MPNTPLLYFGVELQLRDDLLMVFNGLCSALLPLKQFLKEPLRYKTNTSRRDTFLSDRQRQKNRKTERQRDKKTERQKDRKTERQKDRKKKERKKDRQKDRQKASSHGLVVKAEDS